MSTGGAASTKGTEGGAGRASSRLPTSPAPAPPAAFPVTWQDRIQPGLCELVLYALLWLHSIALQTPAVAAVARAQKRNKQQLRLDDLRAMQLPLAWLDFNVILM
jgi:hypothetical protein